MANWVKRLKKNVRSALTGKAGHSPAGKKYLKNQKEKKQKGTQSVYFKGIKQKSDIQRLKDAGLTDKELRSLGYKG